MSSPQKRERISGSDLSRRWLCGGFSGMIAKTATAPLERLKMLAQTGEGGGSSPFGIFTRIVKTEGVAGLFAGNGANLLRVFPAKGIVFASNDYYKTLLVTQTAMSSSTPQISFAAGGLSGMTASAVTYPLDLVRGRISGKGADKDGKKRYSGIMNVLKITVKEEGFLALYKGIRPTLLGAIPYEGIKFGTVGFLESKFPQSSSEPGTQVYRKMAFGAAGGIMAGLITYPNDTTRRLLQLQGTTGSQTYDGYMDCVRKTYRAHGVARFFRGAGVNLIKMVPNCAVQFGAYEFLKELSETMFENS